MSATHVHSWKSLASRLTAVMVIAMMILTAAPAQVASAAGGNTVDISMVSIGGQVGTLTYGQAGTATFEITLVCAGQGGGATFAVSVTGLPTGVTSFFSDSTVPFDNNCDPIDTKTTTLTVQTQATTPGGVTNFTVSAGGQSDSDPLTVSGKALSVTGFAAFDKPYDGNTIAQPNLAGVGLSTGVVSPDVVYLHTHTVSALFENEFKGDFKLVTAAGFHLDGPQASNYTLTQPTTHADITARTLNITVVPEDKVYDGGTAAVATLSDDRVAGDSVTASCSTPAFTTKHAGDNKEVTVTCSGITGSDASNYSLPLTSPKGWANIYQRALTVTAVTDTKPWDGTTSSSGVPTITSGELQGTDTAGFTQIFDTAGVGTGKILTPTGTVSDGNSGLNYDVEFVTDSTGVITGRFITSVTADNKEINEGDPDPAFTFQYGAGDLAPGDDPSDIETPPTCGVSGAHSAPGTYNITCTGGVDSNAIYDFSLATYPAGTLTVHSVNVPPTDISLSSTSIKENLPAGTVLGTLSTTDPDGVPGDTFTYSLPTAVVGCDGTDNGSFQMAVLPGGSPVLQTSAKLHYITKKSLSICLRTADHHNGTFDKHFVITVLPSTLTLRSTAAYDGWILESTEDGNVGGTMNDTAGTFRVGDDAADKQYRSVLHFGTANIPDTAVILRITLKVKQQAAVNATNIFTAFTGLRVDIKKGSYGIQPLELPDFALSPGTTGRNLVGSFGKTAVNGWYTVNLYNTAFPYLNKQGPTQFRLRFFLDDNNNNLDNYLSFYSGNAASWSVRPILTVTYSVP